MNYNPAVIKADMPARFRKLPVDHRGYPVPRFVQWVDGKADFRCIDTAWLIKAVSEDRCWLCGDKLGVHKAFVIGPMCAINRVTAEPPSHLECAQFAVRACPFMLNPQRKRNLENLPEGTEPAPGIPIDRNPGVMLIWVTKSYKVFRPKSAPEFGKPGGVLFSVGEPTMLKWYCRGRAATREEVIDSMESGLPRLRQLAEEEGPEAVAAFHKVLDRGMALVPA
jgi:hypothetical protein